MATSRSDHVKLKIDELENLKQSMRDYTGERLAKIKGRPHEEPETPEEESAETIKRAESDTEDGKSEVECEKCGAEFEAGEQACPNCGAESGQDAGGYEGGSATDMEGAPEEDTDLGADEPLKKYRGRR